MKPAPFLYLAPRSLDEALALLDEHGDEAKPLAGGQSLVPAMNFRLARPAVLVDLNRIDELVYVRGEPDGGLAIGAMTRQRAVERSPEVARLAPLIARTMPHVAHPQIRNRGTFGGSLAHADPAAELPAVALAGGATLVTRSSRGGRSLSAAEFFVGLFATALEPGELLVEVRLPPPRPRSGSAFDEVSRRHGDYALVGAAAELALDDGGSIAHARLAFLSVSEGPLLAEEACSALAGQAPGADLFRAAAELAANRADPPSDLHATAAFRRHLMTVLGERVLAAAAREAAAR